MECDAEEQHLRPTVTSSPSQGRMGMGWAIASVRASDIEDLHMQHSRATRFEDCQLAGRRSA